MGSFYKKFIRNFSSVCAPVTKTMRRNRKQFKWTIGVANFFEFLKKKVREKPMMELPTFNKVF